jgi:hypothetical protein
VITFLVKYKTAKNIHTKYTMSLLNLPKDLLNIVHSYLAKYDKSQHMVIMVDIHRWLGFDKKINRFLIVEKSEMIKMFNITIMARNDPNKFVHIFDKNKTDYKINALSYDSIHENLRGEVKKNVPKDARSLVLFRFFINGLKGHSCTILEMLFGWDLPYVTRVFNRSS